MSEAELHLLKNRMDEGKRAKARRGELFGVQGASEQKMQFSSDQDALHPKLES